MFHHDAAHLGISPDTAVGATAAAAGLNLAWKVPAGSKIEGTPAIVYNATLGKSIVYVQSWNNRLLALDAGTGATIWSYTKSGSKGRIRRLPCIRTPSISVEHSTTRCGR